MRPTGTSASTGLGSENSSSSPSWNQDDVADFVDVVIFGGHPEDGDGGNSFFREFVGGLDGTEGFVEGIGRTTEEADLLAADHGDGTFGEAIEIFLCFGAAIVEEILRAENAGDLSAACRRGIAIFWRIAGGGV